MPSKPYSIEDLHRPATEGRSLHDDASAFYREIMKLQTPIVTVPSKAAIAKAIQAMTKSEAEKNHGSCQADSHPHQQSYPLDPTPPQDFETHHESNH